MGRVATARARATAGAVVALTLACGCTAQAVGTAGKDDGKAAPPRRTASDTPDPTPTRSPTPKIKSPVSRAELPPSAAPEPTPPPSPSAPPRPRTTPPPPPPPPGPVIMAQGKRGELVRELQARLRRLSWFHQYPTGLYGPATAAAVKGFQGKRGLAPTGATDTRTWARLVRMTDEPTRHELYPDGGMPPAKPDRRCLTGRVLCISKESRTLTWMVDGKVMSTMDVRFGSEYTPTREGVFQVFWKSRHHVSTLYDTPMPYAMFFSGGQAVHYSSDFAARGYGGASHGCVNVRDKGRIADLFKKVRDGDRVVIYR
ncbi:L,D-transpeptidase family protein [Streptomyces sp. NRRL B-1347]|uniref:L,D-transpeptidase family protein n=1 Tax=Streptomyces sp. NRRL B-1347 TaxID=1476877 RepID=UPI00099DD324|nr:L,D-transpeptidase family protein [Streptomyces sp. NRRL B-1347]